jgi:hypothetical protein
MFLILFLMLVISSAIAGNEKIELNLLRKITSSAGKNYFHIVIKISSVHSSFNCFRFQRT